MAYDLPYSMTALYTIQEEKEQLDRKETLPSKEQENPQETCHSVGKTSKFNLGEWKEGKKAPIVMARGAAAVKGTVAYFLSLNGEMCSYDASSDEWSMLPKCPHEYSSLAVVRGHITAIGGIFKYEPNTNTSTSQLCSDQSKKEENMAVTCTAISGSANKENKHKPFANNIDVNLKEEAENELSTEIDGISDEQTENEPYSHIDETSDEETEYTIFDGSAKKQAEGGTPNEGTVSDGKTKESITVCEEAMQEAKKNPNAAGGGDDAKSQPKNSEKPMHRNIVEKEVEKEVDTLLSIEYDKEQNLIQWKEHFPPMPTRRQGTAAVSTNDHLIVVGGKKELTCLNAVEVMNIETRVWLTSKAAQLLHPYFNASATICGNELYVLGGDDQNGYTKSVQTCSLQMLIKSCMITLTDSKSVWKGIENAPNFYSTCAAVNLEHEQVLLAIGGVDESLGGLTTRAVYKYNQNADSMSWEFINNTSTQRYHPLVAVLESNKLITVGGKQIPPSYVVDFINNVETADITY